MQDILYPIGELIQSSFLILEALENKFNYAVIVLGFIGLFYWLNLQRKYNKEADENGTYR